MSLPDQPLSDHPNPERQQLEFRRFLGAVKEHLSPNAYDLRKAYTAFEGARAAAQGMLSYLSASELELFATTGNSLAGALSADRGVMESSVPAASRVYSSVARAWRELAERDPSRAMLCEGFAKMADGRASIVLDGTGISPGFLR